LRSVTIGVFDGVHLGHSYIAKKTVKCAEVHHLISTALIFAMPYKAMAFPEKFEGLITMPNKRADLLKALGVEEVIVKNLEDVVNMEAYDFIKMLVEDLKAKAIHVGHDFRFGRNARGDTKMLEMLSEKMKFSLDVIPKIVKDGNRVSSSLIRYELKMGRPQRASLYLGRHFCIEGEVFRERGLGSELGFPTANLRRPHPMLIVPKYGVYLVKSNIDGEKMYGLLNIGKRPTTDEGKRSVSYEVYFIDQELNLTGKHISLELLRFLREEKKFPSLSALKDAISQDVKKAKNIIDYE
jgi:riboflavin kinase/FMN adenylyltransferase